MGTAKLKLLYLSRGALCLALTIFVSLLGSKAWAESCTSPAHCLSLCREHEQSLNDNADFGHVYVCQLLEGSSVVVLEDPDGSEEGDNTAGEHQNYNCSCVSYVEVWGGADGIGGDIPDDKYPGPLFPPPPGGGFYRPGNPFTECMKIALDNYKDCLASAEVPIEAAKRFPDKFSQEEVWDLLDTQKTDVQLCESQYFKAKSLCEESHKRYVNEPVLDLRSMEMLGK